MAKQRHNQPPPESASRGALAAMAIGGLLVAGLIVWALTRTVETSSPVPSASSTITPSSDTSATLVPPIDSTTSVVPPADTVAGNAPTTTAAITTSSQAPVVQGDKSEVARIAAEDLRAKTRANSVVVIDVRDAASYEQGHIPGALHIPMASVEANLDRIPKDKEVVTYCT